MILVGDMWCRLQWKMLAAMLKTGWPKMARIKGISSSDP